MEDRMERDKLDMKLAEAVEEAKSRQVKAEAEKLERSRALEELKILQEKAKVDVELERSRAQVRIEELDFKLAEAVRRPSRDRCCSGHNLKIARFLPLMWRIAAIVAGVLY